MRDFMKQALRVSGINVDTEDLAYIEVQMKALNLIAAPLEKYRLNDVVPVTVFRAEEEKE